MPKNTYEYDAKSIAEDASVNYIKNSVIPDSKEAHRYNLDDSDSQIASHLDSHIEETDCAMFPVWFLSYRKKDRVAYATINCRRLTCIYRKIYYRFAFAYNSYIFVFEHIFYISPNYNINACCVYSTYFYDSLRNRIKGNQKA